jgi:hypothetical protein
MVPKPPGKTTMAREMGKPEFAHEEIAKLKQQLARDVRIGLLFVRQVDVQADRAAAGIQRTQVCRFHNATPAPGADDKAMYMRGQAR